MKMYIVVRQDLDPSQQAVQACHAAVSLVMGCIHNRGLTAWYRDHKTKVIVGVKDECALVRLFDKLNNAGYIVEPFHEPDMDDEMTAFACHPDVPEYFFLGLELILGGTYRVRRKRSDHPGSDAGEGAGEGVDATG